MRGMDFTPDQIARDLLAEVGPGGEFLSHPHTSENFRKELWVSSIFVRMPRQDWIADGEKDTLVRVREKIHHIAENHQPKPLADAVIENLERIKADGQKVLTPR